MSSWLARVAAEAPPAMRAILEFSAGQARRRTGQAHYKRRAK